MRRDTLLLALATLVFATHATRAPAEPMRVLQTMRGGIDGIEGLDGPRSVAVSPDGRHVYVASRGTIAIFERNPESGRLRQLGVARNGEDGIAGLDYPGTVVVSGDGANVYATSAMPPSVVAFARDAETGALAFLHAITEGFVCPQTLARPKSCPLFARLSHDDSRLLVLDGGQFEREPGTGALGARLSFPVLSALEFAQTPDGRHYYGWINIPPDGDLAYVNTAPDTAESWTETFIFGSWNLARVSPDGSRLFGFNRAEGMRRVCWADIDAESGQVGAQTCRPEQIADGPLSAEIAPDGTYYLAGFTTLSRYAWDPSSGDLAEPEEIPIGTLSWAIAPSPDSRFVYSVGSSLTVVPEASSLASGAAALLALAAASRRGGRSRRA